MASSTSIRNEELLRPFQVRGIDFIRANHRVLIADEMGLGKSVQALAGTLNQWPVLIICSMGQRFMWRDEIQKWTTADEDDIEIIDHQSKIDFSKKYYIIHWDVLRFAEKLLKSKRWKAAIVDEAHKGKNRKAKRTRALFKLRAPVKVALTGTPIVNRPDEIWAILRFLYPERYKAYWEFFHAYCHATQNHWGAWEVQGVKNKELLIKELQTLALRRRKKTVAPELPDKIYQTFTIDLSPEQRRAYNEMKEQMIAQIDSSTTLMSPTVLSQMMRLRQIAIGTGFFTDGPGSNAKINFVRELMEERHGRKTVIVTQFVWAAKTIIESLKADGLKTGGFTGETPSEARAALVKDLQEGDLEVLVMTVQTGGEGWTLTAADMLIFVDRPWSPAVVKQAEDRVHRLTTTNNVHIVTLLARDTIEQRIEEVIDFKQEMFDEIFDGVEDKSDGPKQIVNKRISPATFGEIEDLL